MSKERERQAEPQPPGYVKCARFVDADSAGQAYLGLQQTIFDSQADLSCFRLQVNAKWHAVVLGEPPERDLAAHLEGLLATGEPATLPDDVITYLQTRRARAVNTGASWIERHYRPSRTDA